MTVTRSQADKTARALSTSRFPQGFNSLHQRETLQVRKVRDRTKLESLEGWVGQPALGAQRAREPSLKRRTWGSESGSGLGLGTPPAEPRLTVQWVADRAWGQ